MNRVRWLVAVSLTAVAALIVLKLAKRLRHVRAAFGNKKGHPWFAATYDLVTSVAESKGLDLPGRDQQRASPSSAVRGY